MNTSPASAKQISFARKLTAERDGGMTVADFERRLAEHGMNVTQASSVITRLLAAPYRTERKQAEPGFYVRGDEAFKVQTNKAGDRTYALRWSGEGWDYAPGVGTTLADLTPMTAEQAAHLGLASGRCINCCRTLGGKTLSAQVSAVIGYGETCAGNNGWPYPKGAAMQRGYLIAAAEAAEPVAS